MYQGQWRVLQSIVVVSLLMIGSSLVHALPMNIRSVAVKDNGKEDSLQEVLNRMTSGPGINVQNQSPYALFTSAGNDDIVATFIIELAGYKDTTRFGIYSSTDQKKKVLLFDGKDAAGEKSTVSFMDNGDIKVNEKVVASHFANTFGFYVDVYGNDKEPEYTFYSEDGRNPDDAAQTLIYQGDNATTLELSGYDPALFSDSKFIIAFEDLPLASSDKDYNDLVVLVSSLSPVHTPEPSTVLLLGTGFLAMAGYGWRRQRQRQ
jgi:Domain of unknown function (DUF4114)/PEP-CTERM motif